MTVLPRDQDRGIVVFRVLPGLRYGPRLAASFLLIGAGCLWQLAAQAILPGVLLLLAGNLLLLVRGYDNRVSLKGFDPDGRWERVEERRLADLEDLHRRMRRWDLSLLDITNPAGLVTFLVVAALLVLGLVLLPGMGRVLAADAAVLLVPHWVTGTRSILTRPKLLVQVGAIRDLLDATRERLGRHGLAVLMLLRGGDVAIPEDLKLRVDIADRHADFLGLYGQAVINDVQGTSYPYFYVVLVARRGFGLDAVHRAYEAPYNLVAELDRKREVEVLVIRQRTTKNSGYHTDTYTAREIFLEGLQLAEQAAAGVPAGR